MEPGVPQAGWLTGKYLDRDEADFQGTDLTGSRVGLVANWDLGTQRHLLRPMGMCAFCQGLRLKGSVPPTHFTTSPPPKHTHTRHMISKYYRKGNLATASPCHQIPVLPTSQN